MVQIKGEIMASSEKLDLELKKLREENYTLREIVKTYQNHLEKVLENKTLEKYKIQ